MTLFEIGTWFPHCLTLSPLLPYSVCQLGLQQYRFDLARTKHYCWSCFAITVKLLATILRCLQPKGVSLFDGHYQCQQGQRHGHYVGQFLCLLRSLGMSRKYLRFQWQFANTTNIGSTIQGLLCFVCRLSQRTRTSLVRFDLVCGLDGHRFQWHCHAKFQFAIFRLSSSKHSRSTLAIGTQSGIPTSFRRTRVLTTSFRTMPLLRILTHEST